MTCMMTSNTERWYQRTPQLKARGILGPDEVLDPHIDWEDEIVGPRQRAHKQVEQKFEWV